MSIVDLLFFVIYSGFEENADVVGAINILMAGHARLTCEVSGATMPPAAATNSGVALRTALLLRYSSSLP